MKSASQHNLETLNTTGYWLSVVCVVHCVSVPILLVLLPFTVMDSLTDPRIHYIVAALGSIIALFAIGSGFRQHRNNTVMVLGLLSIALLNVSAFCPDVCCSAVASTPGSVAIMKAGWPPATFWTFLTSHLSIVSGLLMAFAHIANHRALNNTSSQCC